jgi:hypothetical protein
VARWLAPLAAALRGHPSDQKRPERERTRQRDILDKLVEPVTIERHAPGM